MMKTMVKFIFFLLFTLITLIGFTSSSDGIADCSSVKQASLRKLMNQADCYIVSTLDGKVTALDLNDNGKILWSYSTDDDGLLQSTIGDFQFISDAIYFKLVPALDGSLYKLNQQYNIIEPVPLNADILLKSSFKLGDDLLINGGKEVRTFAFDLFSGDLIYSCGLADCTNTPRGNRDDDSNETIILIRQLRQKVKAVDPRSGVEQWKFSVGENNAQLLSKTDDCHLFDDHVGSQSTSERTDEKLSISIADGLIRMQARRENRLLWTQNLESPIVGMWLYQNGKLDNVDLFRHDLTSSESLYKKPILYIGSHNNQYYIQHSNAIRDRYREIGKTFYSQSSSSSSINHLEHHYHHHHPFIPQIEWQPNPESGNDLQIIPSGPRELIIPAEGQFIFMKTDDTKTQCYPPANVEDNATLVNLSAEDYFNGTQAPADSIEQIIIISLWHWWKEVAIISICLAILINFAYSYFRRHVIKKVFLKLPAEEDEGVFCRVARTPRSSECTDDNRSTNSTSPSTPTLSLPQTHNLSTQLAAIRPNSLPNGNVTFDNYISRYITDFEPICCLGKGGFGVVFQARNRIDDCHYAVKRIDLPVQQSARDKVMREVRALANLEHHGIVRYYNSWLEVPPLGWQEEADSALIIDKSSYWGSDPNSAKSQLKPNKQSSSSSSSSFSSSSPPINQQWPKNRKDLDNFSFGNNRNNDDDDDSYVVFQNNTKSSVNNNHKTGESDIDNQENHQHNNQENTKQLDESENKGVNFVSKQQQSRRAYLYIQMQLCQKETLREWLKTHKEREKVPILEYFIQIVEAVDYVHSKKLMHRDLKPSNIFFAMDGCVKIGDFGLVTGIASDFFGTQGGDTPSSETPLSQKHQHKGRHTDQVGTKLYMSPEQIAGSSYSNKVDIYSLGVIFFEMLMPFDTEMERIKTLSSIKEGLFPNKFKTNQAKECRLICKLLSCDPDERPLASEILNDPVFFDAENELIIERIPRKRTLSSSKTY